MFPVMIMVFLNVIGFSCPSGAVVQQTASTFGSEFSCVRKDGSRYGDYLSLYPNGVTDTQGFYDKSGQRSGLWRQWFRTGKLRAEMIYEHGESVGLWKTWFENGQQKTFERYVDGYAAHVTYWSHTGKEIQKFDLSTDPMRYYGSPVSHPAPVSAVCMPAASMDVLRLTYSAQNDQLEYVKEIVKAKANLNVMDDFGRTPLYMAAEAGQLSMVRLLIEAGADPEIKSCIGIKPVQVAEDNFHTDVVEFLTSSNHSQPKRSESTPKK